MKTRIEDATAAAMALSERLYGEGLDGSHVAEAIHENKLVSTEAEVSALTAGHAEEEDGRILLPSDAQDVRAALRGRMILSPRDSDGNMRGTLVDGNLVPYMFPAIILPSEQKEGEPLRVISSNQPFLGAVSLGSGLVIIGEAQSQDQRVGSEEHKARVGSEAGHFIAVLTAGVSNDVRALINNGDHVVHDWKDGDGIVSNAATAGAFSTRPKVVELTARDMIAWHPECLPYHAGFDHGLELVQGMTYAAAHSNLEVVKQAAGAMG